MSVQKDRLAGLDLVEIVVLVEAIQRRPIRGYEGTGVTVKEVKLHCGVHALAPVVQAGKPAKGTCVA
jgi:hypothetical protein